MLQSKQKHNPFGKYRVLDFFVRIEFQHRGSPHAHILLWLDNDPKEKVSEEMPTTVQMLTDLCSVSEADIGEKIANQIHSHTFTCTKRGETSFRFSISYWPSKQTRILLPLAKEDGSRSVLQQRATNVRKVLEEKNFNKIDEFLADVKLGYENYLNMIRASLPRTTVVFKRNMQQIHTNTFNPWIANTQLEHGFAVHRRSILVRVVRSRLRQQIRGISSLHRELIKTNEEHPECDYSQLLTKVSLKMLNAVEMSAQEAAWYFLRQPMSTTSRLVSYIPTVWPQERFKSQTKSDDGKRGTRQG
jgi:hypothetical protein